MALIVLIITIAQGLVTFLSPDELRNLTLPYATPFFTKVELFQRYGKLVFAKITDCEVDGEFKDDEVVVAFSKDIGNCYLYDVAQSVERVGGGAFFAVVSDNFLDDYGDFNFGYDWEYNIDSNYLNKDYIYYSHETTVLKIFCLVLLDGHSIFKEYESMSPIWVQYSYNQFLRTNSPNFEFGLTENFLRSENFFSELEGFVSYASIYIHNMDLFLDNAESYEYYSEEYYNYLDEEQCVKVIVDSYKNCSFCLYTYDDNYNPAGYETLMAMTLILNYYYSFSSTDYIDGFVYFFNSLIRSCYNEYTSNCISNVLIEYEAVPNFNTFILYQHNRNSYISEYYYSLNEVFIYTTGVMEPSFIFSNIYEAEYSNFYVDGCDDGCSFVDLLDLTCSDKCNSTRCSYDNLNCIQNNECFSFMLGDGYCNSVCPSDPDCPIDETNDSDDDYFLIVVIVIPIIGGLLM